MASGGFTFPVAINSAGQVVGYYDNGSTEVGFLYDSSTGSYKTLIDPSAPLGWYTSPLAINSAGQVVGVDNNASETNYVGFFYDSGTGQLYDPG